MNILQTLTAPKYMKINYLPAKYPPRGGEGVPIPNRTLRQPSGKTNFIASVTKSASHLHRSNLRPNGENKNVTHPSDHSDSCVRLWWLSHGTRVRLLRRRRHQPHSHHRPHPALAQSHLAAIAQSSHSCGGVRRMGDPAAILSKTYRFEAPPS